MTPGRSDFHRQLLDVVIRRGWGRSSGESEVYRQGTILGRIEKPRADLDARWAGPSGLPVCQLFCLIGRFLEKTEELFALRSQVFGRRAEAAVSFGRGGDRLDSGVLFVAAANHEACPFGA